MYTLITVKAGKKEYDCRVSAFNYSGKNLWLFIHGDNGKCGFIPNGKVIASWGQMDTAFMPAELAKKIHTW